MGAISTRSRFCSSAMRRASRTPNRPSWEPSTPMRRQVRAVISLLMRGPSFLAISYTFLHVRGARPHEKNSQKQGSIQETRAHLAHGPLMRLTGRLPLAPCRWGCDASLFAKNTFAMIHRDVPRHKKHTGLFGCRPHDGQPATRCRLRAIAWGNPSALETCCHSGHKNDSIMPVAADQLDKRGPQSDLLSHMGQK